MFYAKLSSDSLLQGQRDFKKISRAMNWVGISLVLCIFGCLKDFRPSESFITDYLTGPWKNFTAKEVNQEIYPVSTYSYFATLVVVFLITDFVRYKPIIVLCSLSGAITFLLIIIGQSILVMQIVEFFYGLFLSSEVAYYTYIYAKVDKSHYQQVTGHTKAASLVGRCMAGVMAQLTSSLDLLDYHQLNYLTLSAFTLATIWALFLPTVGQSIYFHRLDVPRVENVNIAATQNDFSDRLKYNSEQHPEEIPSSKDPSVSRRVGRAYLLLWKDFLAAYTNGHVAKWSCWWAFSTCGYLQVANYVQLLWQTAVTSNKELYNGAVDAVYAIIGAVTVFCVGLIPLNWPLVGDATVAIFSLLEGALLLLCSYSYNIWFLYVAYIIFGIVYHTMVTVASFEVARCIREDSYGLIFGINVFFALLLQSLLTFAVLNSGVNLDIRSQFVVYGGYFTALGAIFIVMAALTVRKYRRSGDRMEIFSKKVALEKVENGDSKRTGEIGSSS